MSKALVFTLTVILFTAPTFAAEYLLCIEARGLKEDDTEVSEGFLQWQLETLVQAENPFRSRVQIGPRILTFEGEIPSASTTGKLTTHLKLSDTVQTESHSANAKKPVEDTTTVNTSIICQPGTSTIIGEFRTQVEEARPNGSHVHLQNRTRLILTVSKYQPN